MAIKADAINDALVWKDTDYSFRLYDAIGNNVRKWLLNGPRNTDDTTAVPTDLTVTAVNTSTVTQSVTAGNTLVLTTDATEYDGLNIQVKGEQFKLESGKPLYFGASILIPEDTDIDLLVGLCETKTDLLKTSSSHGVNTSVEGVFFLKTDGAKTIAMKSYEGGTQYFTGNIGDVTKDVAHIYELYWDGSKLSFYYDDTLYGFLTAGYANGDLTPSINVRAGSAAARVATVQWMRCIQVR